MKLTPACLLVLFFAFVPSFRALAAVGEVEVSGYLQSRFTSDQTRSPHSDFVVSRARIKLSGEIAEQVSFVTSFDVAMKTLLKDAFVAWKEGPWEIHLGQRKVPFGHEIPQSDAVRLSLERDKVFSVFPSTYDRGAFFNYRASRRQLPVTLTLAILNGNGSNPDNNDHKNLALRIQANPPWGGMGASYYSGDYLDDATGITTAAVRSGVDFQYDLQPVGVRGEYVGGRSKGASIEGWYLEATYSLPTTPGIILVRQSGFDPDTDAPSDEYRRTLIGYAYHLHDDQNARLTLQYGFVNDKSTPGDDDAFGLQFQVRY